ncbi:AtpZ/AtpI family protein [Stackebrandtia soli]|uniref:AtpZ/AtpI family protein n=1 Tax=Stackebrandtia soli TaxID=1892856 RepID=UPI0039E78966
MTNDQTPKPSGASGADQGWAVISYLLAGMILWGGAGWLLDEWLGIPKHLGTFFGSVLGAAAGLYLVVKKFGQPEDSNNNQGEGRKR